MGNALRPEFHPTPSTSLSGRNFDLVQCVDADFIGGRKTRKGPESNLVNQFLLDLPFITRPNHRITVFQEPRLVSGFPDLVAVVWHKPTASKWLIERASLTRDEIRILHILGCNGPQDESRLEYFLQASVKKLVKRLCEIGLITNRRNIWKLISLQDNFAVRDIIALEAKISDFPKAVEQASLNRWFATQSYVLLPKPIRSRGQIELATREGVGVWIAGEAKPILKPLEAEKKKPQSYASWLFNEWAWRSSIAQP